MEPGRREEFDAAVAVFTRDGGGNVGRAIWDSPARPFSFVLVIGASLALGVVGESSLPSSSASAPLRLNEGIVVTKTGTFAFLVSGVHAAESGSTLMGGSTVSALLCLNSGWAPASSSRPAFEVTRASAVLFSGLFRRNNQVKGGCLYSK